MGFGYTGSYTERHTDHHTGSHSVRHTEQRTPLPYANLVRVILLLIVLVAWGLRLVVLDRQDIWWDEARNIDVALRPFTQVAIGCCMNGPGSTVWQGA